MESIVTIVGVIVAICAAAFIFECGRRFYYWAGSKIFGWSEQEKFLRETAWIDRAVEKDQRLAARDAKAAADMGRRRTGVFIVTVAAFALAGRLGLSWWEIGAVTAAVYAGATMAAGLSWKL